MTDDQPTPTTRTPSMSAWLIRAKRVQDRYLADHIRGLHRADAFAGCASCVFSGRFEGGA